MKTEYSPLVFISRMELSEGLVIKDLESYVKSGYFLDRLDLIESKAKSEPWLPQDLSSAISLVFSFIRRHLITNGIETNSIYNRIQDLAFLCSLYEEASARSKAITEIIVLDLELYELNINQESTFGIPVYRKLKDRPPLPMITIE